MSEEFSKTPIDDKFKPIDLIIESKYPIAQTGITKFLLAEVLEAGEQVGTLDFVMNEKTKQMYITGVDLKTNTGKGLGTRAYISLAKLYPSYLLTSSGDYVEQEDGVNLQ